MTAQLERAGFLRIVALGGVGFALGAELAPAAGAAAAADFSPLVWMRMHPDGRTTIVVNQSEMGQGIATALPMMLADELDIPFSSVSFEISPAAPAYYNPRGAISTGGSKSTPLMGPVMRQAGATGRAMLVGAAAQRWNVDPASCSTHGDATVRGPSGQQAKYTELFAVAATLAVPKDAPLKTPDQFRIIGTRQRRLDVVPKTNGRAMYGIDVKRPGMKYASVEKPIQLNATLASYDASATLRVPGVLKVVPISSGVAVIADNTWAAFQGRKALNVTWKNGPNAGVSSAGIAELARTLVQKPGGTLSNIGDAPTALGSGDVVTAGYTTPYLAHATMEPMNCTAEVHADGVTLWVPTQDQTGSQKEAARITGLPLDKVIVNTTFLGGGFGRRGEVDFVTDAVETAKAVGIPIKLMWSREDDIRNDPYRAGTTHALRAKLAADGTIAAIEHTMASSSMWTRIAPARVQSANGVDLAAGAGISNHPYKIPNQLMSWHHLPYAIWVGFWRAPYANANTFATESFIDELAHAAGKDPLTFRLAMMDPNGRPANVLQRAAKMAQWGTPSPAGRAKGLAVGQWDDSWIAVVSEVSQAGGKLKVHRMWASADVGQPVNLDGLDQQLTSAMIYGLSAALTGKITFDDGGAVQRNFNDYIVLRMADSPEFHVDVVRSTAKSNGGGELGTPCVAPSLANALFALTGTRVRNLPFSDALA